MPDKDFEKQVQNKMDELKFAPSEAVWQEVEKQIANRRKRRRFLIWIPFLFLAAGGSFIFFHNGNSGHLDNKQTLAKQKDLPSLISRKNFESAGASSTITAYDSSANNMQTTGTQSKKAGDQKESIAKNQVKNAVNNHTTIRQIDETASRHQSRNQDKYLHSYSITRHKKIDRKSNNDYLIIDAGEQSIGNTGEDTKARIEEQLPDSIISKDRNVTKNTDSSLMQEPKRVVAINTPKEKKEPSDSTVETPQLAKKAAPPAKSKNKIEWGVNITLGRSNISKGITGVFHSTADAYYTNAYNAPGSVNNNTSGNPSSVKGGTAFSLGLSARKNIGKTWSFFADLNYAYFSTKMGVGQKIDSARSVRQTAMGAYYNITSFYTTNNQSAYNYTNRFHFLELPVGVEKRLGMKSRFSLNAGLVISELLGSNALHYDAQKNIFYNDNGLINKTQLSAFAGFNYQLRLNKSSVIDLGPRFQYGLTDYFNKDVYGHMHLLAASLSTHLLFGK